MRRREDTISRTNRTLLALLAALAGGAAELRAEGSTDMAEIGTDVSNSSLTDELELDPDADSILGEGVDLSQLSFAEKLSLLRPRLSLHQAFIVDSDFGDQKVDTYISAVRGSVAMPLSKRFGIRLVGSGDLSVYDFDGDDDFIYTGRNTGAPFDDLVSNVYRLEGVFLVSEDWRLLGGGYLTSRFETGVAYANGVEAGGFTGVAYQIGKEFSIVFGLGIGTRMDSSRVGFSPIIQFDWQVTDDIDIQTEGLGLRVGAKVSKTLTAAVFTGFEGSRYRLGSRNGYVVEGDPASGQVGKGTLRDRRLHAGVGLVWKPGRHWRLRGSLGLIPYQQYTTKDHDGHTLDKAKIDHPAFASAVAVEYRF